MLHGRLSTRNRNPRDIWHGRSDFIKNIWQIHRACPRRMKWNSLWVMACKTVEIAPLKEEYKSISRTVDPRKWDDASYLCLESFRHSLPFSLCVDQRVNLRPNQHLNTYLNDAHSAFSQDLICVLNIQLFE